MLDAYVIEEIKRREREKTRDDDRPSVELPIPLGPTHSPEDPPRDRDDGRGVVIIDYS
jgi:hypothetical protein